MQEYRVLDGGVLIPLDGVWYHSSEAIHCDPCLGQTKNGMTTYYHSMRGTAIVRPGTSVVLPLMPEYIRNEDGNEKQDGERNAAEPGAALASADLLRGRCIGVPSNLRPATRAGDELYLHLQRREPPVARGARGLWGTWRSCVGGDGTGGTSLNTGTGGHRAWRIDAMGSACWSTTLNGR